MNYFNSYNKENLKQLFIKEQNDEKYCEQIFEALYNYYKAFYCSKNYTMKIMITRRSYVLFKIFSRCFEISNDEIKKYGDFYTNNYISHFTRKQIKSNKILIIDDIIINGRTAGATYNELVKICNNNDDTLDNAFISAFLINREGRCLEEIKPYFISDDKIATTNEFGWREISDLLNVFIARMNIGYVSYIDTYYLPEFNKTLLVDSRCNLIKYLPQSNALFYKNNIESYIGFPTEDVCHSHKDFFVLLKKLNIVPCYRLYQYNNFWTFVPFAFLPSISKEDFGGYFSCVIDNLDDKENKLVSIKEKALKDCNSNDKYIFWYEWLTFILSKCLADIFLHDNNLSDSDQQFTNLSCVENFNEYYVESIYLKKKTILPDRNYSYYEDEIRASEEKECVEIFKNLYCNTNDGIIESIFSEYLFQTRIFGQKRALNHLERLRGIRVDDVINNISNISIEEIIKTFINCWDCGEGSGSPKIFGDNKEFICTSMINGEQVYRYPFDVNAQVTFDFKLLYENCLLPIKMIIKMFPDFANYMSEETGSNDYKIFASNFNDENYDEFENSINSDNIVNIKEVSYSNFALIMRFIKLYISKIFCD